MFLRTHKLNVFVLCMTFINPLCYADDNEIPAIEDKAAKPWASKALGFEPSPQEGLLGDWLGVKPALKEHGFKYTLGYLSQSAYNIDGGYDQSGKLAYIDQFWLMFKQDLEGLTGIPDATIDGNIVNRNHDSNLTRDRTQDPRSGFTDIAQESWGGGSITRLGWLTFSRSFMDRKLSWRIGLMNKQLDFDQIIPCDFQTLGLCGGKSASGGMWYNWNVHYWGTSLKYKFDSGITLKTGLYEQNPETNSRGHAWSISTTGSRGVVVPLEVEWRTRAINQLPGAYNLGVIYTNASQKDRYKGKNGGPGATDPDGYDEIQQNWYLYAGLNQQVTQHKSDADRGMSVYASLGLADQRALPMHYKTSVGLRYRGLFDARPEDMIGLGIGRYVPGDHFKDNRRYLNQLSGVTDVNSPQYRPVPGVSLTSEVFYRWRPIQWLELQPGVQYWHNPGGVKQTSDAWVGALKAVAYF